MIYPFAGKTPVLAAGAFVAPNATVLGDVVIKRGASVWYGAVLRGDLAPIVVGEGSNVQDNAVLHTDVDWPLEVGEEVTIGHGAILHGCQVGAGALIGMGATLLNGCSIGVEALVAAQSLVPAGFQVEARQQVRGVPARPCGEVAADMLQQIQQNAAIYRRLAQEHQQNLLLPVVQLFKLVVFVPTAALESLKEALFAAGAGEMGNYSRCSWQVQGTGTFQPQSGSHPTLGQLGRDCLVDEYRLETLVAADKVAPVIKSLLTHHPYESPAFDLYLLSPHANPVTVLP